MKKNRFPYLLLISNYFWPKTIAPEKGMVYTFFARTFDNNVILMSEENGRPTYGVFDGTMLLDEPITKGCPIKCV